MNNLPPVQKTVWFGVKTVNTIDILYTVHSRQELDNARKWSQHRTAVDSYINDQDGLRVVVLWEGIPSVRNGALVSAQAVNFARGNIKGGVPPKYSEPGAQQ